MSKLLSAKLYPIPTAVGAHCAELLTSHRHGAGAIAVNFNMLPNMSVLAPVPVGSEKFLL